MKLVITNFLSLLFLASAYAQVASATDFKQLDARLAIKPQKGEVAGELHFIFDILKPTDSVIIDAKNMEFSEVLLNGQEVKWGNDQERLWISSDFEPRKDMNLYIKYEARPRQAMYFIDKAAGEKTEIQLWTQGQGKYTSHWLPSFDRTAEKLEFDLQIDYPADQKVIANGNLVEKERVNDSLMRWTYDMVRPMSSYLVAIAAGNFRKVSTSSRGGVPLDFYYPEGKQHLVEPTYRYSARIMDFLEKRTGVKYPWQNYKQVPVRDFLYSGMENTGTTLFSDAFLVDSTGFNDRNYVNVNAHELAHQWFGNLVTASSGEHHWLQEGFATYYALLAEREIFGEDYFYWRMFESAEELKQLSDKGKGESLLNPKASSLTFYQKGAWALFFLENLLGREAFDLGVKNYLERHQFGSVSTKDFLLEMEQASGRDLSDFRKDWLRQTAFQGTEALALLKESPFMKEYMKLASLKPLPVSEKKQYLQEALSFPVNDYLGQEAVYQLALEDPSSVEDLYRKAFESNNLYTRQAIALSLERIPAQLRREFETLLEDDSYMTKQLALYKLWKNFPSRRTDYLEQMEEVNGFSDKNVRTLWLALSLATPEVDAAEKREYFLELSSYTEPHHRYQLRQNAFNYLYQLAAFDAATVKNLADAKTHHNYRFRNFARRLAQRLIDEGSLKPEVEALLQ